MLGVIADVHGNRWALEAVLEDLERRGVERVVNLGDCFYGPLDPAGTAALLAPRAWPTVRGNQDRALLEDGARSGGATAVFTLDSLGPDGLAWLASHTRAPFAEGGRFFCHGTPASDVAYLLERVEPEAVRVCGPAEVSERLGAVAEPVICCAHSHVPRVVRGARGELVVNPGSVGLPAYSDDEPWPHAMESASPHARYALLAEGDRGPRVELVALPYDHEAAAAAAEAHGRADWAASIRTGFAR